MSRNKGGMVFEKPPYWKGSRYPDKFFEGRVLDKTFNLYNSALKEHYEAKVVLVDDKLPRVRLYIPHFDQQAWCKWADGRYNQIPMAGRWKMQTVKGTPRACDWRIRL